MTNDKIENMKEFQGKLQELQESLSMDGLIKDNTIPFEVEDKKYRVRLLTTQEQNKIQQLRRKKYTELMMDDSYMFKKQWIEIYLKKGIDISAMENKIKLHQAEINNNYIRLAETTNEAMIENFKNEIQALSDKIYALNNEMHGLLGMSIENSLEVYLAEESLVRMFEIQEQETWKPVFASYEEYQKCEDMNLLTNGFYYRQILTLGLEQ